MDRKIHNLNQLVGVVSLREPTRRRMFSIYVIISRAGPSFYYGNGEARGILCQLSGVHYANRNALPTPFVVLPAAGGACALRRRKAN